MDKPIDIRPERNVLCPVCKINMISPHSVSCKKCPPFQSGENNSFWKGDKVGYAGLHCWINRRKPKPVYCELCGEIKNTELALKIKEYTRNIYDYWYLCRRCHMMIDGRLERAGKFKFYGKTLIKEALKWNET